MTPMQSTASTVHVIEVIDADTGHVMGWIDCVRTRGTEGLGPERCTGHLKIEGCLMPRVVAMGVTRTKAWTEIVSAYAQMTNQQRIEA